MSPRSPRFVLTRAAALAVAPLALAACGSRGPLETDTVVITVEGDASSSGTPPVVPDAAPPGNGPDAGPIAIVDAAPEANVVNCGVCVAQSCGTVIATCVADTTCRTELQCIATTCLAGGAAGGPACFLQCAGGNLTQLGTLLPILTCINTSCGPQCGSVLGGLGGGGLPGIPGSGGGMKVSPHAETHAEGRVIFSAYPEICASGE